MQSTTLEGGAFYLNGPRVALSITGFSSANKLKFISASAFTQGGLLYSNNAQSITLTNVQVQTVTSQDHGAVMYIN